MRRGLECPAFMREIFCLYAHLSSYVLKLFHYLIGLTSFGYGCGDGGVVTRISNYYDWILGQIN